MSKVTISLADDLLEAVEQRRTAKGLTRSEFFRYAVEQLFRQEQAQEESEQYIRGYQQMPETDDELRAFEEAGYEALSQEPWE